MDYLEKTNLLRIFLFLGRTKNKLHVEPTPAPPEQPGTIKPEPDYIGKNVLRIWWENRIFNFDISIDRNGMRCSFIPYPGKTVICAFKWLVCIRATGYIDEVLTKEIIYINNE